MSDILRNLKWELDDFEQRIENNELDEETKARLREALATIRKVTNIKATRKKRGSQSS